MSFSSQNTRNFLPSPRTPGAARLSRHPGGRFAGARRPLRWAFLVFVLLIPFEAIDTGLERFTPSKFAGYVLLLVGLLYPGTAFRRFPAAGWFFVFNFLVFASLIPFQPDIYQDKIRSYLFGRTQMLVLFWISYNLLRHRRIAKLFLGCFSISCFGLALLNVLGIAAEGVARRGSERISAFGQDPNNVAAMFSVGVLAMLGLVYGRIREGRARNLVVWVMLPVVAVAIARTGSRGSLAALAGGLLVFLLRKGTPWTKVRNLAIVAIALGVLAFASLSLEMNRQRWEQTLEGGTMSGRETIFPAAWKLFLEKPLAGWGPATNVYVLGARFFRESLDTHNLYLYLLTEVGLLGSIPYFAGLFLCLRSAWKSRSGPQGVLPLAMMIAVLLINMSLTWHVRKVYWLILAFALASSAQINDRIVRRRRRLAVGTSEPRTIETEALVATP